MKGEFITTPTPDFEKWDDGGCIEVLAYRIKHRKYYIVRQQKYMVFRSEYCDDGLCWAGDGGLEWNEKFCHLPSCPTNDYRLGVYDAQQKRFLMNTVPISTKDVDPKELKENPADPLIIIVKDKVQKYKRKLAEIIDEYDGRAEALEEEQHSRYRW